MQVLANVSLPSFHPFVGMDVPAFIRDAARRHGDRNFLIWEPLEGSPSRWSYAETCATVERMAADLITRGVSPGDAVVLHFENSPESIFTWLACGFVGAVAITTNPRCSAEEFDYFVKKVGAVGIVTQPAFLSLLDSIPNTRIWRLFFEAGAISRLSVQEQPLAPRATDPAAAFAIQFTSGTTSRPKGVLWTHANALWGAMVNARHLGLGPQDVALVCTPLCHTVAQAWQVLATLWAGGAIVLQPGFSASRFWDVIVRNGCTWATTGPFIERALQDTMPPPEHRLRFILNMVNRSARRTRWGVRSIGAHGMTETITQTLFCDSYGPLEDGAVGRPAPEYEIDVRDAEGRSLGVDEPGELLIRGVRGLSLFAGYWNDEDATTQAFTTDGYFRTGDIVQCREDGAFIFVGRSKDMMKVGGENVAASEVEAVIARLAGVKEVAVVAQDHAMLGEVPFVFVIPNDDATEDLPEQIIAVCRAALSDFKVPRGVRLVNDFPRSVGAIKVAKATLRTLLREEARP